MIIRCKIGAKKDGTFTALEGTIYNEQGAYASPARTPPAGGVHAHAVVMLRAYESECEGGGISRLYESSLWRRHAGFGAPQSNFAHESLVDELADLLKMDPTSSG